MSHGSHPPSNNDAHPVARRRLLAGAAGAAGAAAAVALARTAEAADGDNAIVGELNEGEAGATVFRNTSPGASPAGSSEQALVGEIVNADNASDAVVGSTAGAGAGVAGTSTGGYGGRFAGGPAQLRLVQTADPDTSGPPTGAGHLLGELYVDPAGNLWFNRSDGEDFTRLNDQGGITMFTDSQRAFDSREEFPDPANPNKGRFSPDEIRVVDLTEFTDFPAGATGAVINLTVAETGAPGFVLVFNGDTADADIPNSSSINWVTAGDFVANGVIVPVGAAGTVKVFALQETEVIIDVVGFIGAAVAPTPPAPTS